MVFFFSSWASLFLWSYLFAYLTFTSHWTVKLGAGFCSCLSKKCLRRWHWINVCKEDRWLDGWMHAFWQGRNPPTYCQAPPLHDYLLLRWHDLGLLYFSFQKKKAKVWKQSDFVWIPIGKDVPLLHVLRHTRSPRILHTCLAAPWESLHFSWNVNLWFQKVRCLKTDA